MEYQPMRIGIVGGGVVGQATARSYLEHVEEVRVYDVLKERATHSLPEVLECDLIFVCLPTPQKKDSLECDVSALDDFFNFKLGSANREAEARRGNFVLRSTVPIGTTKRLREMHLLPNLVHSPEFLTARCATVDAQIPSRNIIGHTWIQYNNYTQPEFCAITLKRLYGTRFPHIPTITMSSDESEAVKLFQNSFFAVKVSFWNECNVLATKLGLDWERVMEGILSDGRIHPSHTKVPGHHGFGFSGTCLPKDLANLAATFSALFPKEISIMENAHCRNTLHRKRS